MNNTICRTCVWKHPDTCRLCTLRPIEGKLVAMTLEGGEVLKAVIKLKKRGE